MTPRPVLTVQGEDVYLEIPGFVTIRAAFLSEGLYDGAAGGDPDEQDLYEIEVSPAGGEFLETVTFPRLMPASDPSWLSSLEEEEEGGAATLPAERFLLVLGWELANAHRAHWEEICRAARGWDAWMVEDALTRIPPEWTPEPLLPDED